METVWDWDDADIGAGIEIPANSGSSDFDWKGAFQTGASIFGSVAGAAATIYQTRNSLRLQRENNAISKQQNNLANQLAMTQAAGAVDIAKAKISAEVARNNLQAQLAGMGLPFLGGSSVSSGLNLPMIAMVAAVGYGLFKLSKK